jgi:hypothetical protein
MPCIPGSAETEEKNQGYSGRYPWFLSLRLSRLVRIPRFDKQKQPLVQPFGPQHLNTRLPDQVQRAAVGPAASSSFI